MASDRVSDVAFEDACDVGTISLRLHPVDVGFDLRDADVAIALTDEGKILRASYPDRAGNRRVMSGPRDQVIGRLKALGFRFA